jgi:hypothetical protein
MPLDALGLVATDDLTALGIIPVPNTVLIQHMQRMLDRHHGPARQWFSLPLYGRIADQLARVDRLPDMSMPRWSSAPWRVRRLADKVQTALPEATFTLGYFYRDPYLSVQYGRKDVCLAIWLHRFHLVAIAQQTNSR